MWLKVVILNVVNLVVQVFHNLLLIYNTISWVDRTAPKIRKYPERSSCVQKNVSSTGVRGQTGLTAWTTAATKLPLETTETCRTLLILDFFAAMLSKTVSS